MFLVLIFLIFFNFKVVKDVLCGWLLINRSIVLTIYDQENEEEKMKKRIRRKEE